MERPKDTTKFSDIDRSGDPGFFVSYLERVSALDAVRAYKQRTLDLLEVASGHRILDVGCGVGDEARALARRVGRQGWVIGLDQSEAMVMEARRRSKGLGLPLEFRTGDAHALDFPDNSFDGCRAERTLQHLADPWKAIGEMVRVVRSHGPIVVADPDWETLLVDSSERPTTRRIAHFHCDALPNGWMGRQLRGLLKRAKLQEILVEAVTVVVLDLLEAEGVLELRAAAEGAHGAGLITDTDFRSWIAGLEEADREGRFFASVSGFIARGRKP